MAFNVNEIRAQLTYEGARPTLFQVQITNPINTAADLKVPFMVQASSLPATTIGQIEVPYMGRKIKVAGDRTYAEWSVTVINDEDFLIRNAMEGWVSAINTPEGNTQTVLPGQYKSQGQVTQFGKDGTPLRIYNFNGIFPTNIAEIAVDWNTTDTIEQFDVTFQYDYWTVRGGSTGDGGTRE